MRVPVRYATLKDVRPNTWEAEARYPVFGGTSPVARAAGAAFRSQARKLLDEFLEQAREDWKGKDKPVGEYLFELDPIVGLAHPDLVSGYFTHSFFTGGAHPNAVFLPHTFGRVGGRVKRLTLKDLLKSDRSAQSLVTQVLLPALNAQKKERGAEPLKSDEIGEKALDNFVVTPTAITWLFSPYAVGAYAEGPYVVKIPLTRLREFLAPNGPLRPVLAP